jgi:Ni,Fe-hydrogenase III large subunit
VEREAKPVVASLAGDTALRMRLEQVGVLTQHDAIERAVIGPVARASGLKRDIRHDFPYGAYSALNPKLVTRDKGDIWARLEVRVEELFDSIRLIRQALDGLPEGAIYEDPGEIPPGQEGISMIEAPRGACTHYVLTGENGKPYRWRVLAPTYMLLQAVPDMLGPDTTVSDFPILAASVDPCFSCTERYEIVRKGGAGGV